MSALLALLVATQTGALPQPDPYGQPPPIDTPERLAYDAQRGGASDDAAIDRWLAAHRNAPTPVRAMLFHRLCVDYGVHTGGEARVAACTAAAKALGGEGDASDLKVATAFRHLPPVAARGSATVPLIDNLLGSKSADVTVNGITLPWFVDTGAEIATLTDSTAARLGVRIVEGSTDAGTSTGTRVVSRLGVIDKLTVGQATIEHLPVLILPDAMLTITKDYTIPAILGLPAFAALGRIAWLDGGRRLALGQDAPAPTGHTVRVYWHEDGLGIPVRTHAGTRGAHFDSGSNTTSLYRPGMALLDAAGTAALTEHTVGTGGVGGIVKTKVQVLPRFDYSLADTPVTASDVSIEDKNDDAGRVGNDMIVQTRLLTIDFRTMTLAAEPITKP